MADTDWQIFWTPSGQKNLLAIMDYVQSVNPSAARQLSARLRSRADSLRLFPESGRIVPEFPHRGWRELIVGNYRLIYRIRSEARRVEILAIVHGARELTEGLVPEVETS